MADQPPALSDDLLYGARAIAQELGLSLRKTYHLIYTGEIPTAKLGPRRIVASRQKLREHFAAKLND